MNEKLKTAREAREKLDVVMRVAEKSIAAEVEALSDEQVASELKELLSRPDTTVHICGAKDPRNPMGPHDARSLLVDLRVLDDSAVRAAWPKRRS